jgi:hypothetical protein
MSEKTKMIHAEKFINGKQHGHKKISWKHLIPTGEYISRLCSVSYDKSLSLYNIIINLDKYAWPIKWQAKNRKILLCLLVWHDCF